MCLQAHPHESLQSLVSGRKTYMRVTYQVERCLIAQGLACQEYMALSQVWNSKEPDLW